MTEYVFYLRGVFATARFNENENITDSVPAYAGTLKSTD